MFAAGPLALGLAAAGALGNDGSGLTFCCSPSNDLYLALGKPSVPRYESPAAAIQHAAPDSAVLLLADGYPAQTTATQPSDFASAEAKGLRLFIEYPASVPGLEVGAPRPTVWERLVVSSDQFQPGLPRMRLLAAHDCRFVPVSGICTTPSAKGETRATYPPAGPPSVDLVVARVAGYDTAIYGLPDKDVFPVLFEVHGRKWIVATTKLSGFVTGRYAPARDWLLIWERILAELCPDHPVHLQARPLVHAAWAADERLPRRFQRQAFAAAANWFAHSHLLVHPSEKDQLYQALARNEETTAAPRLDAPEGDGSLGILEGYASGIRWDGTQVRRLPLRSDCNAETAMVLALDGRLNRHRPNSLIASNLLDFIYFTSGTCAGPRADPQHGAFGLIGWGDISPAWLVASYGDDDARVMLSTAVVAASLGTDRWDQRLMRALLANLRTTGKLGFRGDRLDLPDLEKNGWKHYYEGELVDYSPHFESYLWACYLWAYHQTGYAPFLERALTAIGMTMKVYPDQWRWRSNLERARMLLCLAWMVRVEDTPEHREWLRKVAGDLAAQQRPSGSIYERSDRVQSGFFQAPQRNEDYGTGETPLIQENGDPVSDQLYTTGFALLGLHEAVGATGDRQLKAAEDKLAEYLCRIQTRSERLPYLSGTWFRAFDDRRWEAWASSADIGWGAWSLESGWGQAWTAAVLALREQRTTVWEYTAHSHAKNYFAALVAQTGLVGSGP
ncbi:MAG TPA: hypothetical protein VMU04_09515 [Candidatus Acidoferrum sp.]|nr:hypothetical protein [Candidatus Acidoferrum sp.]